MKLKELQSVLRKKKADFALFFNLDGEKLDTNFLYFSGYSGFGFLVVQTRGTSFLIVPKAEARRAKKESRVKVFVAEKNIVEELKRRVGKPKLVGVERAALTLVKFDRLKKEIPTRFMDISKICADLRVTKTEEELKIIKKACKITDEIFKETFLNFKKKKFKTESDVEAFMTGEVLKRGLEVSFKPIIASADGSSEPHHLCSKSRLKKGFCKIDFGLKYKGYCSDVTRMLYLGKPSKQELEDYDLVLKAAHVALNMCKQGVICNELDKVARAELGVYSENFIHGLGHGVGLNIHEPPTLNSKSKDVLKSGMVFTIEPGVYFSDKDARKKSYGIRVENDILMTAKGPKILTGLGTQLLIIPNW